MEKENINIGKFVEKTIKQRGLKPSEVANAAGITRQRLNGWLKKSDLYVKDLFTLSKAVGFDFVAMFNQPKEDLQKTRVVLQIEIEQEKSDEVLRYIKDNELYNILKKT